jgi:hypothetical protein
MSIFDLQDDSSWGRWCWFERKEEESCDEAVITPIDNVESGPVLAACTNVGRLSSALLLGNGRLADDFRLKDVVLPRDFDASFSFLLNDEAKWLDSLNRLRSSFSMLPTVRSPWIAVGHDEAPVSDIRAE